MSSEEKGGSSVYPIATFKASNSLEKLEVAFFCFSSSLLVPWVASMSGALQLLAAHQVMFHLAIRMLL